MLEISLIVLLFSASTLFLVLKTIVDDLISPLRTIPGPWLARYTRLWYYFRLRKARFQWENVELHRIHDSKVVRYAPNRYSISDPAAIKTIYGLGQGYDKSAWYRVWDLTNTSIFVIQDNKVHSGARRKINSAYSMSTLVSYEPFVNECTSIFHQRLAERAQSGETSDLAYWLNCYTTDAITQITYGKRLGNLDNGEDVEDLMQTLKSGLEYGAPMGVFSEWHPLHIKACNFLSRFNIFGVSARGGFGEFANGAIDERRKMRADSKRRETQMEVVEAGSAPTDFLDRLLDLNDADPARFTDIDVRSGLVSNIGAGADTTAATATAVLYYIFANPHVLAKLRAEIAQAAAAGSLSTPISFKQAQELPYLHLVIKEAQRLHPAVGLPLERVVPAGGAEISGHYFPAGSIVGINAWVLHYDPDIFGPDAGSFRPERWLEADKEILSRMNSCWMPFGLGSRTCIGKNISLLEITKMVPEILRQFDFELEKPEFEYDNHWFVIPKALRVRVKQYTS